MRTLNWQTAMNRLLSRCLKSMNCTVGLFSPVLRFSLTLVFSSNRCRACWLFWIRPVLGKLAESLRRRLLPVAIDHCPAKAVKLVEERLFDVVPLVESYLLRGFVTDRHR